MAPFLSLDKSQQEQPVEEGAEGDLKAGLLAQSPG